MVADVVGLKGQVWAFSGVMSNRKDGTRIIVVEEQVEVLRLSSVALGKTILVRVRVTPTWYYHC